MADAAHLWGNDLSISATGDLALSEGSAHTVERLYRRLLSNPAADGIAGDLVFNPTYGAGLPRRIGTTTGVAAIEAIVRSQLFQEASVAQEPQPVVIASPIFGGVSIRVTYTDRETGETAAAGFSVER